MRSIPWTARFDRVLSGSRRSATSATTRTGACSRESYDALKPGGLLAVEMNNRDNLLGRYLDEVVTERGEDRMIDRHRFDVRDEPQSTTSARSSAAAASGPSSSRCACSRPRSYGTGCSRAGFSEATHTARTASR